MGLEDEPGRGDGHAATGRAREVAQRKVKALGRAGIRKRAPSFSPSPAIRCELQVGAGVRRIDACCEQTTKEIWLSQTKRMQRPVTDFATDCRRDLLDEGVVARAGD